MQHLEQILSTKSVNFLISVAQILQPVVFTIQLLLNRPLQSFQTRLNTKIQARSKFQVKCKIFKSLRLIRHFHNKLHKEMPLIGKEVTHQQDLMDFLGRLAKLKCFKMQFQANRTQFSQSNHHHLWMVIRTIEMFSNLIRLSKMLVTKSLNSKRISALEEISHMLSKAFNKASIPTNQQASNTLVV